MIVTVFKILFWGSAGALVYTYLLFPALLKLLASLKGNPPVPQIEDHQFPEFSILIPAHNEEGTIAGKLESIYASDYPISKIEVHVLSDASTDHTVDIVSSLSHLPNLYLHTSDKRLGKPEAVNALAGKAKFDTLIFTDANVFFHPDTLRMLARHFLWPETGLADTRLEPYSSDDAGISFEEKKYLNREFLIKYREGLVFGKTMGPSGACFAVRKRLFKPIPEHFLVDDFFIGLEVLRQGYRAVADKEAVVYEDPVTDLSEAFRRKIRIATGNFQNLRYFRKMFRNIFSSTGFLFWSHKGLRWYGPFLMLATLVSNIFLIPSGLLYLVAFILQAIIPLFIIPDIYLQKINKHIVILRFVTHYYYMNLALLLGWLKNWKGIDTNVWEPTKRNIKKEK